MRKPTSRAVLGLSLALSWGVAIAAAPEIVCGQSRIPPGGGVAGADAGLRVVPTRIVLEGRKRNAELVLVNTGPAAGLFRIGFVQMRMLENGQLVEIDSLGPGEVSADRLVRFSPRQIELDPQATQTVRLRLEKPSELGTGEYRSHLVIRAVPAGDGARDAGAPQSDTSAAASGSMTIALRPIYGVAVPVIVRQGETSARVRLRDLRVSLPRAADETLTMSLRILREGNRSVFGNISVQHERSDGRKLTIGGIRGVAVYLPNSARTLDVPLHLEPGTDLASGRLKVTYRDPENGAPLAEAELVLP